MALVVESSTSASSIATSVTLTKPTGVAIGNLLMIFAAGGFTRNYASTGFTEIYDEFYDGPGGIADSGLQVFYKIADSGDVAASNYSVTGGGSAEGSVVAMVRISGWDTGNPIYQSDKGGFNNSTSGTFTRSSLSLPRVSQNLMFMVMTSYDDTDSDYYGDATTLTVTSSDTNPSWTEVCNIKAVTNASTGVSAKSMTIGYAATTGSTTVTGFSFAYTEYDADHDAGGFGGLLILNQPEDASGTNTLHTATPIGFNNAGVDVGGNGTNALHTVSPTMLDQSGRDETPAVWTPEVKTATTWTPELK